MQVQLPPLIAAYFDAVDAEAIEEQVACFSIDANVNDVGEHKTMAGHDAIRKWLTDTAKAYRFTVTPADCQESGENVWTVQTEIAGSFPGSPLPFAYTFTVAEGSIHTLLIEQK
ncbi:nuclear transport factor 2 family protein [Paraburkholderia fynbosensis]|uniref:SnoaL-like domain-containing protein n=1 Tax=Paraburkholderia fynbosensis TaxID=1200993 RepID=A0A6J5GV63_9BURK|nr:nuclear transport factor 2 family protein [Paraburkholderia fynbosensis]CAB3804297.1 hypothetical protein LMG27177_05613 [Paraburkholderia fynbosensis]